MAKGKETNGETTIYIYHYTENYMLSNTNPLISGGMQSGIPLLTPAVLLLNLQEPHLFMIFE